MLDRYLKNDKEMSYLSKRKSQTFICSVGNRKRLSERFHTEMVRIESGGDWWGLCFEIPGNGNRNPALPRKGRYVQCT